MQYVKISDLIKEGTSWKQVTDNIFIHTENVYLVMTSKQLGGLTWEQYTADTYNAMHSVRSHISDLEEIKSIFKLEIDFTFDSVLVERVYAYEFHLDNGQKLIVPRSIGAPRFPGYERHEFFDAITQNLNNDVKFTSHVFQVAGI